MFGMRLGLELVKGSTGLGSSYEVREREGLEVGLEMFVLGVSILNNF